MSGRFRSAFAGLLVTALVTFAGAAEGPIRLPVAPVVPTPMPAPVPPGGSLALGGAMIAIVDADVDCIIIESVPGLVKIDKVSGPRDVTAIFAGGMGGYEDRSYAGKNLYRVKAAGKGTVTLSVVPVGVKSRDEIKTITFSVDAASGCPDVKPPPKPVDPVTPKVETFRVVLVYESSKPMTAAQVSVVYGKEVEQYLTATCTKDGNNNGWRRHDKDDPATGDTETFNAVWAKAKAKVQGVPCLAIEVNGVPTIEPLPATIADTITLLKKYAGGK